MHADIVTHDIEVELVLLEQPGARRLHPGIRSFGPTGWTTMADPEENGFCVSTGVEWCAGTSKALNTSNCPSLSVHESW